MICVYSSALKYTSISNQISFNKSSGCVKRPSGYEPGLASTAQKGHSEPSEITTTAAVAMSSVTNIEETYKVEPLQGSANYRTWKFSMRMVLQARDLWEVVSGEEVKPEAEKAA